MKSPWPTPTAKWWAGWRWNQFLPSLLTLVNRCDALVLVQHLFVLVWGHQVVWRLLPTTLWLWLGFSPLCGDIRDSINNAIILFCGTILNLEEEYCSLAAGKPHLNKALLADLLAHRFSLSVVWQPGWRNISWYSVVMYDHVCLLQHKTKNTFFFLI